MKVIRKPIIPLKQTFYNRENKRIVLWRECKEMDLDYSAIAIFIAIGFMLDDDTFYDKIKVLKPASNNTINKNKLIQQDKNWEWHYNPIERSIDTIVDEFSDLFESLISTKIQNKKIVLPLSGGLDSRTLLVPLKDHIKLVLFSYEFEGGYNENKFGQQISSIKNWPFYAQKISSGYLWKKIDLIANYNNCFTDFTHPRQIAVINQMQNLGDSLLLGHWGDVLFDKQSDCKGKSVCDQFLELKLKLIKPGGLELASDLWEYWGLASSFEEYFDNRVLKMYENIKIDHCSARMRAFKSLYWAPRWTSINLSIFESAGNLILPYYDDEMLKFICTVPERYLKNRKIQIEYIKKYYPQLAKVPLQKYYPLNLYNYDKYDYNYYLKKIIEKITRKIGKLFLIENEEIRRNWELQFLGSKNLIQLKKHLKASSRVKKIIPVNIIDKYLNKFQINPLKYAHAVSMLLTFIIFINKDIQE